MLPTKSLTSGLSKQGRKALATVQTLGKPLRSYCGTGRCSPAHLRAPSVEVGRGRGERGCSASGRPGIESALNEVNGEASERARLYVRANRPRTARVSLSDVCAHPPLRVDPFGPSGFTSVICKPAVVVHGQILLAGTRVHPKTVRPTVWINFGCLRR